MQFVLFLSFLFIIYTNNFAGLSSTGRLVYLLKKLLPSESGANTKSVFTTILTLSRPQYRPGFSLLLIDLNYVLFPLGMLFQVK